MDHRPSNKRFDIYQVASLTGSLPMGGYVEDTPVFAIRGCDYLKPNHQFTQNVTRTDLDLGASVAFYLDGVISPEEARTIIDITEAMGYRAEAPGIMTPPGMRMNKSVHWVSNMPAFDQLYARFKYLLPQQLEGSSLYEKLSCRLNMYKYDQDDVFNRHTDGDWPGFGLNQQQDQLVEWVGPRSKLTMILYLNGYEDGVEGGETKLFSADGSHIQVSPRTGRALFFRHGQGRDSVIHEGGRVTGGISKYVARINVLYV